MNNIIEPFNHAFNKITKKIENIAQQFNQYNTFLQMQGTINRNDLIDLLHKLEQVTVSARQLYGLDFDIDRFESYQMEKKAIQDAFQITVNIINNTVHIKLPNVIPKRSKDTYMRDSLNMALEDKVKQPLKLENVIVIFIYHFAENVRIFDYDNLETRSILNVLTKYILKDDSPQQMDMYQTARFDGKTYTEIWIMPKNNTENIIPY